MSGDLAIIPARGGSRRIYMKNIRNFAGIPMVAHSIRTAIQSGLFAKVVVSTDDPDIAAVAREYGAETPFLRKKDLSDDHAPITDAVKDAIIRLDPEQNIFSACCCIFATAPLLRAERLTEARMALYKTGAPYVLPVVPFSHPPGRALSVTEDDRISQMFAGDFNIRTQDHAQAFHDAGQFYYGTVDAWVEGRPVLGSDSQALKMSRIEAIDIDNEDDWVFAEVAYHSLFTK